MGVFLDVCGVNLENVKSFVWYKAKVTDLTWDAFLRDVDLFPTLIQYIMFL